MKLICVRLIIAIVLLNITTISFASVDKKSLDGQWQFTTTPTDDKSWKPMTVPGNWDTTPEFSTYSGKGY